ncbi:MAG: TonB-dependent receptor plug domain-containing protein, partial [Mucilaginibacter polytrichastri]|nr:TonB-dependent receptor plug domain-containing protein [Mucilaginibacter polytrichastri]
MNKKHLRYLKSLCVLAFLLLISVTSNSSVRAQNNITLQVKGATLKEALNRLQSQTQLNLTYADKIVSARSQKINFSAENQPFNLVLSKLLLNTGLTYRQDGSNIIIYELPVKPKRTVTGTVTDSATKEPLVGVSVQAQTSRTGTTTDLNGKFSLQVDEGESILLRIIGYQDRIIANPTAGMNIVLKTSTAALNEVVVVGYGTQKKVNLTGAVAVTNAEDIAGRPLTAVSTGLSGLVPGLTAVSPRGQPGASNAELRIRGVGTTNNSNPFVLIDGIPGDLNWINPSDIESVSVLKDAASASIYGSRAANGVILVTTKKGKFNQKPAISYTGYYGAQVPTALPKMLGSVEYMQYLSEAQTNAGLPLSYTADQIQKARDGSDPNYFANTNWPNALIKSSAPQQEHNLSVAGGGENTN